MYRMAEPLDTAHIKRFAQRYCALHFGCVFLFAMLYWIPDLFEHYNPGFSRKYLGLKVVSSKGYNEANTLYYWIWYSLITQTTLGYGGLSSSAGKPIDIQDTDYPFKVANLLQIASLIVVPLLAFS